MEGRYSRNMNTFSQEDCEKLHKSKVCVIGLGGLGGYIVEMLARLGVHNIKGVDGDVFDPSNLNRQLFSKEELIGKEKAMAAKKRVKEINSNVEFIPVVDFLKEENSRDIIKGYDLVIDALDNMNSRLVLQEACNSEGIPMIHGAIAGWYGQVTTIFPGDNTLNLLYQEVIEKGENKGEEVDLGNPAFTPACIASIEVCEAAKVLLGKEEILRKKILVLDLLNNEYEIV